MEWASERENLFALENYPDRKRGRGGEEEEEGFFNQVFFTCIAIRTLFEGEKHYSTGIAAIKGCAPYLSQGPTPHYHYCSVALARKASPFCFQVSTAFGDIAIWVVHPQTGCMQVLANSV